MPELPDVTVYVEALDRHVVGQALRGVRIVGPSLLRTWEPPIFAATDRRLVGVSRLGKRIVLELEQEIFLVIHLMIAGRLRWRPPGASVPGRIGQAAFDFTAGTLLLTEASARKRATLHLLSGRAALGDHDPGGLDVLGTGLAEFAAVVARENHTLKRFLTSPRLLDGIGNAYSDEILHAARLSPLQWTSRLTDAETRRLYEAARDVLRDWTERLREEVGEGFPDKVTAFRPGMAVHGRFREPCPACGAAVQRILYVGRETNYCPTCQTGGQVYADRVLSQLLGKDWPRTVEEWEQLRSDGRA
jgi:formamidopyrimidine-DNA glycosylase